MLTFKEAAALQIAQNAEAERNADVVRTMSNNMERLAEGDLTADIDGDFPASYAALKAGFNTALANLRDVIGGVANGTEAIRTGSSEIAQASEDLARRTEANAASLEETSAALVQIEGRIKRRRRRRRVRWNALTVLLPQSDQVGRLLNQQRPRWAGSAVAPRASTTSSRVSIRSRFRRGCWL